MSDEGGDALSVDVVGLNERTIQIRSVVNGENDARARRRDDLIGVSHGRLWRDRTSLLNPTYRPNDWLLSIRQILGFLGKATLLSRTRRHESINPTVTQEQIETEQKQEIDKTREKLHGWSDR